MSERLAPGRAQVTLSEDGAHYVNGKSVLAADVEDSYVLADEEDDTRVYAKDMRKESLVLRNRCLAVKDLVSSGASPEDLVSSGRITQVERYMYQRWKAAVSSCASVCVLLPSYLL